MTAPAKKGTAPERLRTESGSESPGGSLGSLGGGVARDHARGDPSARTHEEAHLAAADPSQSSPSGSEESLAASGEEEIVVTRASRGAGKGKGIGPGSSRPTESEEEVGVAVSSGIPEYFLNTPSSVGPEDELAVEGLRRYLRGSFTIRIPEPTDRVCFPREREIGVYVKAFEMGLRFPLAELMFMVLRTLGLPIFLLTPNSLGNITAFIVLCALRGVPTTMNLFRHYFKVGRWHDYYYIGARQGRKLILDMKSKVADWEGHFVFIQQPDGPLPPTEWGTPDSDFNIDPVVTELIAAKIKKLKAAPKGECLYRYLTTDRLIKEFAWPRGSDF